MYGITIMRKYIEKNSKHLYAFTFVSFTILIFLIIFIIAASLYMNFTKEGSKMSTQVSNMNLQLADSSINKEINQIRLLGQQMVINEDIKKLMSSFDFEENNKLTHLMQTISLYSTVYENIDSVYVYSSINDYIYSTTQQLSDFSEKFYDKEIIKILKTLKRTTNEVYLRKIPSPYDKSDIEYVYSFLFIDFNLTREAVDGAIVINLKASQLVELLEKFSSSNSKIYCVNQEGSILCSPVSGELSKNFSSITNKKITQEMLDTQGSSGTKIAWIANQKNLINFTFSNNSNWYLVSLTPYNIINAQTQKIKYFTIFISCVLLLLSVVAAFLISKSINIPMKALISKNSIYEIVKSQNFNNFRSQILQNLILEASQIKNASQLFKEYNIHLNCENEFLLILFKINHLHHFIESHNEADRKLKVFALGNIASEVFSKIFQTESAEFKDYIVLIVNLNKGMVYKTEEIKNLLIDSQNCIEKYLKLSVTCIVSNRVSEIKDLYTEYTLLLENSNYKIIHPTVSIIFPEDIMIKNDVFHYPEDLEKTMLDSILMCKLDSALKYYDDMVNDAKEYSYENFTGFLSQLLATFNYFIIKYETTLKNNLNYNLFDYMQHLSKAETLEEIDSLFKSLIKDICYALGSYKDDMSNNELIKFIDELIKRDFSDPNLSVNITGNWVEIGTDQKGIPGLEFSIPTCLTDTSGRFEIPFGAVERASNVGDEVPGLRWGEIRGKLDGKSAGLLLANDSKYGYAIDGGAIRQTLIRSSYSPDNMPENMTHTIKLTLRPFVGELPLTEAICSGEMLNHPLRAIGTPVHGGKLSGDSKLLTVDGDTAVICGLKVSEDGSGLIVRLFDTTGKKNKAVINIDKILLGEVTGATEVDILERPTAVNSAVAKGNTVTAALPAFGITTVKISLNR